MVASVAYVLRLLANLVRLALVPFRLYSRWSWSRGKPRWITLHLQPRIVPFRARDTLLQRLSARARDSHATSLEELRALSESLGRDPAVAGLLVHVPSLEAGWSACEGVRDTFRELRARGKHVVCYVSEGGGNRELYVALAASHIYMAPYSAFGPLGLAARPFYIRPLLDRLGITVEAQAAGEYKSAAEPALRDTMSEPAREQLQALLTGMHNALAEALRDRGVGPEQIVELFERGMLQAKEALANAVIDGIIYEDELAAQLKRLSEPAGAGEPSGAETEAELVRTTEAERYVRFRNLPLWWRPLRRPPCIAVVPLRGTIVGEQGARFGSGLRPSPLARTVRALAKDPTVRAVLFYIDSPGGSALASELMHREMRRLAEKKPTVACFGDVAASGGYYLACACQKIVSPRLAVTGSIGVVSAKVDASALLDRLGIRPQFLRTAPSADLLSFARGLSPAENALLKEHAGEIYDRFLAVVAEGRGRSVADIEPLARGRVWLGSDAAERGLVDVLGGFERAVDEVRSLLPDVPEAERAALKPRVFALKSAGAGLGFGGLRTALLGPWAEFLPDIAAIETLRREAVTYYAPLTTFD
ncbi:MAG: hypothetical protein RL701_7939 [Pseudomonadota bacterium]|jgi:protease-4